MNADCPKTDCGAAAGAEVVLVVLERAPIPNVFGCPENAENPLVVVGRGVEVRFENAPPAVADVPTAPVASFIREV